MRMLSIAVACLTLITLVGCEAPTPPRSAERIELSPLPPEPAKPRGQGEAEPPAEAAAPAEGAPAAAPEGAAPPAAAPGAVPAPAAPAQPPAAPGAGAAMPPAGQPAPAAAKTAENQVANGPPAEGDQLSKAEVGVGVKGKDYGGPGFVTTPIETLFRTNDRIAFEVQIPKAMSLYKADHNNKGPKTHDEFMKVIIQEHGVQLPELPQGNVYWYDAKTEELLVRTPKAQ